MHRVASRQRLFSWDHFDARPAGYEENDNTDNNHNNNNNEHDAHDNDQNIIRTTIPKTTSVPNTNIEAFASSAELILPFASEDDRSTNNENENDINNDNDINNYADYDNTDDLSDYGTCISMSRHGSMLFTRSSSFGLHDAYDDNDDDDDDDNDGHGHGDALTNVISDDEDSDEENCHDNCSVITTPLSMISMSIPRTQPETEPSSILLSESINDVLPSSSIFDMHLSNQDVQLHILSFLDLNGLRSMNLTCRYFMNLLSEPHHHAHSHAHAHAHSHQHDYSYQDQSSCVRNAIWWNIIKTTWPSLSLGPNEQGCNNRYNNTDTPTTSKSLLTPDMVQFVAREKSTSKNDINDNDDNDVDDDDDDDNDSVVMNHNNNNHHKIHSPKAINYGALLIQAKPITNSAITNSAPAPPTCIDPSFFQLKSTIQTELIRVVIDNSITLHRRRQQPTLQHRTKLFSHYVMDVNKDDLNAFQVTDGGGNDSNGSSSRNLQLEVVQYVGRVGVGDRSIRSNQPFPRPLESLPVFIPEKDDGEEENDHPATSISYSSSSRGSRKRSLSFGTSHIGTDVSTSNDNSKVDNNTSVPMKFLNRLRTCNKRASTVGAVIRHNQHRMSIFANSQFNHGNTTMTSSSSSSSSSRNINSECKLPFVSPIVSRILYKKQQECPTLKRVIEIDLTPRLMAYFEVSILPRDLAQEVDVNSNTNPTTATANRLPLQIGEEVEEREASSSACVAIGLSKREYSSSVRMPGWDSYSYGYHGDDGGIFHSKGDMIRVYGPKYNVGDTVGCGVNYSNGGIFFTLNGDFLGYAWCNEKVVMDGRVDLYPTIGVDAPNPLVCNFGNEQPFIWDFPKFVATNGSLSVP